MLSKSQVKYIQSLGHKKHRDEDGVYIAEGPKLVEELLAIRGQDLVALYATQSWLDTMPSINGRPEVTMIEEHELAKISQLSTPNSALAILRQDEPVNIDFSGSITLLLDRIQDPGNLGTIIRIGDWFGIHQIVCLEGSSDRYNSKTVQSTMGSIARVKVEYMNLAALVDRRGNVPLYGTTLEGKDVRTIGKIGEGIIVIGNESKGINPALLAMIDHQVTIQRVGSAESLNAAVATGIILSHII